MSHLQYADDTIFICPGKIENIRAVKYVLRNFELMSGLGVNFSECSLWCYNLSNIIVEEMASVLGCSIGTSTLSYLGINVGIMHRRAEAWTPLVDKIRKRLAKWEDKQLSFGGRITLIQAVLSAIPIYVLSFYYLPKKTLSELVSIQHNFLRGGE